MSISENRFRIPQSTYEAIKDYVEKGWEPGGFVRACLENNLMEAVGRADGHNIRALHGVVKMLYNDVPQRIWGSPEAVNAHLGAMREHKIKELK